MATHSSIPAWRIPWTEEPGSLQSMGLQESDTTDHACTSSKGGYGKSCDGGTEAIEDSDAGKD